MSLRRLAARLVAVAATASGWSSITRRRRHRRGDYRLYILEYHDISDHEKEGPLAEGTFPEGTLPEGTVSAVRFRRHLKHLKQRLHFAPLTAAHQQLQTGNLDHDLAVVTFDDGYAGNYEAAWPVLRDAGIPATIFLTTGFLDGAELWFDVARRTLAALHQAAPTVDTNQQQVLRTALGAWPTTSSIDSLVRRLKYLPPGRRKDAMATLSQLDLELAEPARPLSWQQVNEMLAAGIEFGAHTVTHPILSTLEPAAQENEIAQSRQRIAETTGTLPTSFAFPNGSAQDYNHHTVEILERLGFAAACSTRRGSNAPGCQPLTLKRLGIGSDPLSLLDARLAGLFDQEIRARFQPGTK